MIYRIRRAHLNNDGTVTEGKRTQPFYTMQDLNIGGLYFLRKGKLYRIVERIERSYND